MRHGGSVGFSAVSVLRERRVPTCANTLFSLPLPESAKPTPIRHFSNRSVVTVERKIMKRKTGDGQPFGGSGSARAVCAMRWTGITVSRCFSNGSSNHVTGNREERRRVTGRGQQARWGGARA
eukprot:1133381-Rhodomonas_salina.2